MAIGSGTTLVWRAKLTFSTTYRFSDVFDKPFHGVTFPCGLREIFLGDSFDQPIEGIIWPGGLERLSLPGFNHSIRDVQWPPGLKALEFMSPSRIRLWEDLGLWQVWEVPNQVFGRDMVL